MAKSFTLELITPEGLKYSGELYEAVLPTQSGEIGILAGHEHLLTILKPGVMELHKTAQSNPQNIEYIATAGGFVEVDQKRVRILADTAERAEEIDEFKAKEALKKAKQLQSESKDKASLSEAVSIIERESARLKVADLKRRHRKQI
jgi:F-type H+-transporting ATPase subunit epsilon